MAYLQQNPLLAAEITVTDNANFTNGTGEIIKQGGVDFIGAINQNTFVGISAGNLPNLTTGDFNCAIGYQSGASLVDGSFNTFVGRQAGQLNVSGTENTYIGYINSQVTTGSGNTCIGSQSGSSVTGSWNTVIGANQGTFGGAESSNVLLANPGTGGDNNVMRLGTTGVGARQVSTAFIAGVYGVTTASATTSPVLISDGEQLGTIASSIRFKKDVEDMSASSAPIMQLRPVTFHYKAHTDNVLQYGLIAEEVNDIMPGIVNLDQEGKPFTVRYHDMVPMLLNELQKLAARVAQLEAKR